MLISPSIAQVHFTRTVGAFSINRSGHKIAKGGRLRLMEKLTILAGMLLAASLPVRADLFLDGSTLPTAPWSYYADDPNQQTLLVDFFDPILGATNQALRISSDVGATEWYYGFAADEVVGAARFRLVDFSPLGKENLLCVTTSSPSDTNAPAPSITLVDGRYKLWSYVNLDSEIVDIGPADSNAWHTAYISARKDGQTRLWWDGVLLFDGTAPPANPYGAYLEWGSGSWQADASDTVDFDWVGYSSASGAPILIGTTPSDGNPYYDPSGGFTFKVLESLYGVTQGGVSLTVNGVDRTGDLVLTGGTNNLQGSLTGGFVPNHFYQAVLTLTDLASNVLTSTINFQTFSQTNYMFEAEDWNFDGGQWLDTIVLSSIPNTNNYVEKGDVPNIDESDTGTGNHNYRGTSPVGAENTGDWLRQKYLDAQVNDPDVHDVNVGWVEAGEWLNYTRTFPAGEYNIYARLAYDQSAPFEAILDKVTGATTENQTTNNLGSFKGNGISGGGQIYSFVPLTDAKTNRVVVSLNGVATLRATAATSGYNANFYMLVPAEQPVLSIRPSGSNVVISWYQLAGETYALESAPTLLGPWTNVVNSSNPFTTSASESARFFRLTAP